MLCAAVEGFCASLLEYIADSDTDVDAMDRFNVFLKDYPAGNGFGNLVFHLQSIDNTTGWFRRDYGAIDNMDRYGTIHPPQIPLGEIAIPTGLFVGYLDKLSTVADNEWLVT